MRAETLAGTILAVVAVVTLLLGANLFLEGLTCTGDERACERLRGDADPAVRALGITAFVIGGAATAGAAWFFTVAGRR